MMSSDSPIQKESCCQELVSFVDYGVLLRLVVVSGGGVWFSFAMFEFWEIFWNWQTLFVAIRQAQCIFVKLKTKLSTSFLHSMEGKQAEQQKQQKKSKAKETLIPEPDYIKHRIELWDALKKKQEAERQQSGLYRNLLLHHLTCKYRTQDN